MPDSPKLLDHRDPLAELCHEIRHATSELGAVSREELKLLLKRRRIMRKIEAALAKYCESIEGEGDAAE